MVVGGSGKDEEKRARGRAAVQHASLPPSAGRVLRWLYRGGGLVGLDVLQG
jgi:hypothetical protein